jgi:hypothetical protein
MSYIFQYYRNSDFGYIGIEEEPYCFSRPKFKVIALLRRKT